MVQQDPKNIYDRVFKEIRASPQIYRLERGLLYKIIQIILMEDKPGSIQEKTETICKPLGITSSALKKDDNKIIANIVDAIFMERQALAGMPMIKDVLKTIDISSKSVSLNQTITNITNEEANMKWFVITACLLVGVYFCIKYLEKTQQQKENKKQSIGSPVSSAPSRAIPAALCFVVPAKIVYGLQNGSTLTKETVIQIAENAAYFNCTTRKNADINEEQLVSTNDDIRPDSQAEVYIRIETDNGRDLISAKTAFSLKRNLLKDSQFIVKQLFCLKNLSGLEVFTRI